MRGIIGIIIFCIVVKFYRPIIGGIINLFRNSTSPTESDSVTGMNVSRLEKNKPKNQQGISKDKKAVFTYDEESESEKAEINEPLSSSDYTVLEKYCPYCGAPAQHVNAFRCEYCDQIYPSIALRLKEQQDKEQLHKKDAEKQHHLERLRQIELEEHERLARIEVDKAEAFERAKKHEAEIKRIEYQREKRRVRLYIFISVLAFFLIIGLIGRYM